MKRFVCLVLIALMLIPLMAVSAETAPSLIMTGGEGQVGETVDVVVSAANLPDCASFQLILQYDAAVLKPTAHVKGDVSGLYYGNLNYTIIEDDGIDKVGETAIKIVGATSSTTTPLLTGNPTVTTVTFEILAAPESSDGALVNMVKYTLSKMDTDLTRITGIPLPSAYVTVPKPEITQIEVTTLPGKLEYLEAKDTLDVTGGKVTVYYDNDTTDVIDLTADMVTGFDNTVTGSQELTVTYEGFTDTFDITVKAKSITKIEVTTLPTKTEYLEAKETLDVTDGKVTVFYDNDTTDVIDLTADMVTGFDNTVTGPQELTVTYGGFADTFDITVKAKAITKIEVTTLPTKTEYLEAKETLDVTGGKVTVYYDNDTTDVIDLTADMVTGFDNTKVGPQELTVTYQEKTAYFDVEIIAKAIESIAIAVLPAKTEYVQERDGLDLSGGKLRVTYNNGEQRVVDLSAATVTGFDNRTVGEQTLTVTYGGKTATLKVTVLKKITFTDVPANEWYYTNGSIQYVYNKGLMTGMTATSFAPEGVTTRAQLVTILWRLEGEPAVSGDDGFTDVASGDWFYDQVRWAVQKGIVNGMGDGTFAPNASITRGQMAAILFRYTTLYKGIDSGIRADLRGFADVSTVPDWCYEAMQWAVAEELISGTYDYTTGKTLLDTDGTATRAQIATVLMRYVEKFRV